jgi:hypothetical protein
LFQVRFSRFGIANAAGGKGKDASQMIHAASFRRFKRTKLLKMKAGNPRFFGAKPVG